MRQPFLYAMLCVMVTASHLAGQHLTPEDLGLTPFKIKDDSLGEINYYITSNGIDTSKPVLIYLDGSGPYPLFQKTERGIGSSVVIDFRTLSHEYHIVFISKPGVPFFDAIERDEQTGRLKYDAPQGYHDNLSLDWRVHSAILVIEQLKNDLNIYNDKIAVLGISEGFQVGAKLASVEPSVSHLLLLVGNGLNQFYDFVIQNRLDAQRGIISPEQSRESIDSLMRMAKEIYANPTSTDRFWFGHTYLRWASFTKNNPTQNIMSLNIPVYIVAASNDRNTSVLGTDYLYLESITQGKNNLEYHVYPYDHSFNEFVHDHEGNLITMNNHMKEVLEAAFQWLASQ